MTFLLSNKALCILAMSCTSNKEVPEALKKENGLKALIYMVVHIVPMYSHKTEVFNHVVYVQNV